MNKPSPASRRVTPPVGRAVAHIDLGAIERNCAHIRSLLADGTKLCAVVKANAYGHGDTSCAKAALAGRDFVVPEDVKAVAIPALAHRLTLRPELWVQRIRGEDIVAEALETVPTPPAEDSLRAAG